MKSMKTLIVGIILIFNISNTIKAQTLDLENVKSELKEAALKEQNAFKKGDCDQVLSLMENDITFLANGRKVPSKQIVGKFCNSIPRPFKTALIDKLDIYPLTNESGYTIRTLEYPNDEETKMQEYVTKIWRKANGKWKISHLHSTVKKVPITN
tara:strand:+ start:70811 stop:71272 length:462 start_codon:yes stop_codon:yes gene_type:complete